MESLSPSRTPPRQRWWLLLALCVAAAIAYLQRQVPGTIETSIRTDLRIDKEVMASVLQAFFLSYAALQLPAGWMCQAWGVRRSLAGMVAVWSVACLLAAASQSASDLRTARYLLGAAQAGLFTGTTLLIRDRFFQREYGLANGLLATGMQVGGLLGSALVGQVAASWSWQLILLACALPGLPWIVWFLWLDTPPPADTERSNPTPQPSPPPDPVRPLRGAELLRAALWLTGSGALWCLCTQQFFRAAAQAFYATWFATYLREARHLDQADAGWYTAGPIAAAAVGPFLGGWLSDWLAHRRGFAWGARHGLACVLLLGCAGLMAVGHLIPSTPLAVTVIALANLLSAAAGPAAYSASMLMGGRQLSTVFAIMNMTGNFGAAVFPRAVIWFLPVTAQQGTSAPADWNLVFWVIAGTYLVAAHSWLLFDSNRRLPDPRD